jgi:hypothetical protein
MHKVSTTMHKSTLSKDVTCLKKNNHTSKGPTDLNNQNGSTKNMSVTPKIAVIDIERENRQHSQVTPYFAIKIIITIH